MDLTTGTVVMISNNSRMFAVCDDSGHYSVIEPLDWQPMLGAQVTGQLNSLGGSCVTLNGDADVLLEVVVQDCWCDHARAQALVT